MNDLFEVLASMDGLQQLFLATGVVGGFCSAVHALCNRAGSRREARDQAAEQTYRDFQVLINGDGNTVQIGGDGVVQQKNPARTVMTSHGPKSVRYDANGDPVVARLPEPPIDSWCAGCDRLMASRWMAFDDDKGYRCRACRGLPESTQLQERLAEVADAAAKEPESMAALMPVFASLPNARDYVRANGGGTVRRTTGEQGYRVELDDHNSLAKCQARWTARQKSSQESELVLPPRGPYPLILADVDRQQRCACGRCRSDDDWYESR